MIENGHVSWPTFRICFIFYICVMASLYRFSFLHYALKPSQEVPESKKDQQTTGSAASAAPSLMDAAEKLDLLLQGQGKKQNQCQKRKNL